MKNGKGMVYKIIQSIKTEQFRKIVFYVCIIAVFFMVLAYNIFTPYLSDDLFYKMEVNRANSLWDLIKQQYNEYLSNSGRIIGQFNVRLSLIGSKMFFNIINSGMFIVLSLLIYGNIYGRKKHDTYLFVFIVCLIWRYSVEFGQTILWLSGACNYLWGSVIILSFITFYRSRLDKDTDDGIGTALLCLIFGIVAGWCNENTSGGAFLLILLFSVINCYKRKKENRKMVLPYMVTAHLGMICGLTGMLMAPGIVRRAEVMDDNYSGLLGFLSRFYKISMTVRELFFELLCFFIIVSIVAYIYKNKSLILSKCLPFFIAAIATSYALIMSPPPMDRAHFGAGIFLIIAFVQSFVLVFLGTDRKSKHIEFSIVGKYAVISLLLLWLFFTYIENLVNLGRIYREEKERIDIIREVTENGEKTVVLPQYRIAFENRFSNAHASDMTEDPDYWINIFYQSYYNAGRIVAIPRDEWNELYADEDVK